MQTEQLFLQACGSKAFNLYGQHLWLCTISGYKNTQPE
jgi:hypothetical protein